MEEAERQASEASKEKGEIYFPTSVSASAIGSAGSGPGPTGVQTPTSAVSGNEIVSVHRFNVSDV